MPATPTIARAGCYKRSFAEIVPNAPGHMVKLYVTGMFQNNPLKTIPVANPPLELMVTR